MFFTIFAISVFHSTEEYITHSNAVDINLSLLSFALTVFLLFILSYINIFVESSAIVFWIGQLSLLI